MELETKSKLVPNLDLLSQNVNSDNARFVESLFDEITEDDLADMIRPDDYASHKDHKPKSPFSSVCPTDPVMSFSKKSPPDFSHFSAAE